MRYDDLFTNVLTDQLDAHDETVDRRKIVICTTPRTGGHSCCQQLRAFGLGVPTEYFQIQYATPLMRRWSNSPDLERDELPHRAGEYGAQLLNKRSRNGIFATKIFYENLPFMREALGADDDSWFYVRLTRRDKVAQTISLLSMTSTGRAFDSDDQIQELVAIDNIGPKNVQNAVRYLHQRELAWSSMLASIPQERKSKIFLEDFIKDAEESVRLAVADWFTQLPETPAAPLKLNRYSSDNDLKNQIKSRYSDYIAEAWKNLPATEF